MRESRAVIEAVERASAIGVSSHVNPDGDGVGSLLACALLFDAMGKMVYASLPDPSQYPPQYLFLPGRKLLADPGGFPEDLDLFVALDCSNPERLGALRERAVSARTLVNIDHHEDNRRFAHLNLVDPEASSTSELVHGLIKEAGWRMSPEVATCLYTGLVTDTGRFQHRNTTPQAFRTAAELATQGADIFRVVKEVYESQSLSYARLLGRTLERMQMVEELGLAYSFVTREDLSESGAVLPETEDLIDHLRIVRGARLVALFKELEDGRVRVSLRSEDDRPVGPVARALGGGGHANAAGYTSEKDLRGSLEELLELLRRDHG